jgi:hypothetical protein
MGQPKSRKPSRIGVIFDGIFWQNLHDYREYAHKDPKRFDMKGVLDSMRWYAAREVFSRPHGEVTVPAAHFIWTDGRRNNDLRNITGRAGIEFSTVPIDPRTDKGFGFEMELALTAHAAAYGPPRLDLIFLCTGTDAYAPLLRHLKMANVKIVVPNIDVDYQFERDNRARYLSTTHRLTDRADYSPPWDELLEPDDSYPLVRPLYDIPAGERQRPLVRW